MFLLKAALDRELIQFLLPTLSSEPNKKIIKTTIKQYSGTVFFFLCFYRLEWIFLHFQLGIFKFENCYKNTIMLIFFRFFFFCFGSFSKLHYLQKHTTEYGISKRRGLCVS